MSDEPLVLWTVQYWEQADGMLSEATFRVVASEEHVETLAHREVQRRQREKSPYPCPDRVEITRVREVAEGLILPGPYPERWTT